MYKCVYTVSRAASTDYDDTILWLVVISVSWYEEAERSTEQKLRVLLQRYSGWRTPLHWAAWRGHSELLSTLLTSLQSSADRLKLPMVYSNTPLHTAAFYGHTESVKVILDCLTTDQQIQLMSVQSMGDMTAIQYAESTGQADTVRYWENINTEQLIWWQKNTVSW